MHFAVYVKIYFGGAGSSARARLSLLLRIAQTQRTARVCSRQSGGTWPAGVCILVAVKHKMAHARLRRLALLEVMLQPRSPELPLLYLTCEASSIWTNKLELMDTGWKVAGDVHGVDPLGISQALGFSFEQPCSQGSHMLL